ncbi:alcohol dehydrogenase [Maritimibacter harenae]|uniref:alcohol dehydrogenase n=1 Tax=Maritimibacter harenae TaxID=2606218 RepID=UPI002E2D2616|nr:alcohol dehydrogenase [Maritimibacter harenae]
MKFGTPLVPEDREDMVPEGSEIIMDVLAAGVCHSDLHIRDGGYDLGHGERLSFEERGMHLPHIMGHEPVARIARVGPDVPGDLNRDANYLVYPWNGCGDCDLCREGKENFCATPRFLGVHVDGAYSTQVRVPHERYLFPIGDMAPEHAAPLACSGLTTYSALKKVEHLLDRTPAVLIGAGGLGLMAVGLVKAMGGLPPVVVDIDPAKRQAALDAGAAAAIDGAALDAQDQITKAVGKTPEAVVDFVGAEATTKLGFECLGKDGTMVVVGLFGGASPWQLVMIAIKSVTIRGSYMGSLPEFRELMELVTSKSVPSLPTITFDLDSANAALDRLVEGKIVGRAVLMP